MRPAIGKRAFIPMRLLDRTMVREARSSLVYEERVTQRVASILGTAADEPVKVDECVHVGGRIGLSLPRAWAMQNLSIDFEDRTVNGDMGKLERLDNVRPRDDRQTQFFGALLREAKKPGPQDILANATTGAGKSVAGIFLGLNLNVRTLILVDRVSIGKGWLANFRKFYGDKWTEQNVGWVQQDRCDYGKRFSVGIVQSIAARQYDPRFYSAWGLVVYDEVQIFGGPHFAPVLGKFPARVRVGLTAENRGGQFGQRIKAHLGDTRIVSLQEVMHPKAWLLKYKHDRTFYCYSDGALLNGLARIRRRNEKLAKLIAHRGHQRGRHVLILSNRTEQLQTLRRLCHENHGIPIEDMGLYCGKYTTDRYKVCYSLTEDGKKQTITVAETKGRADGMVNRLKQGRLDEFDLPKALYNRLQKGGSAWFHAVREEYSPTQPELDNITNSCQLIFATYEIFSKGVDVQRLDMGVEALPSGNVKQPLGRVLRIMPGKQQPEWYAIHDTVEIENKFGETPANVKQEAHILNSFFSGKTKARIAALKKANATVKVQ